MKVQEKTQKETATLALTRKTADNNLVKVYGDKLNKTFTSMSSIFNHLQGEPTALNEYLDVKRVGENEKNVIFYINNNSLFNVVKTWHEKQEYKREPTKPRIFADRMIKLAKEVTKKAMLEAEEKKADSEFKLVEEDIRRLLFNTKIEKNEKTGKKELVKV